MREITPEEVEYAKKVDLLTYLQSSDPGELVRVSANTYCTREHDSLKISNGKWYWFSRNIGGHTALQYLTKVKDMRYYDAVAEICGRQVPVTDYTQIPRIKEPRRLLMPKISPNADCAIEYLKERGINPVIIDYCLEHNLLFETERFHNVAFVGYDKSGKARYAALRGTQSNFKSEVTGSDKHFSFCINPGAKSGHLHIFEAGKHVVFALPHMHLRRPVVPVGPEGAVVVEADRRTVPVLQVAAHIHVKAVGGAPAGLAAGAVQVISAAVDQHKGVADIDLSSFHVVYPSNACNIASILVWRTSRLAPPVVVTVS